MNYEFELKYAEFIWDFQPPALAGCLSAAWERPFAAGGCELRQIRKEAAVSIFPGCRR